MVTPGRTRRASSRSVSATTRPAACSAASSSGWSIDTLSSSHIDVPATSTRPSRGDVLELTIDSLAHGGNGVARHDGYVVFVAGAVPGDRVRAVVGKAKKAYAEARAVEIVAPSPDRVPPFADHPGAPWQVLPYERQLEVKAEQVDDALQRIGS